MAEEAKQLRPRHHRERRHVDDHLAELFLPKAGVERRAQAAVRPPTIALKDDPVMCGWPTRPRLPACCSWRHEYLPNPTEVGH